MSGTGKRKACAAAAVVGVWTTPESPREMDAPALASPVSMENWLAGMTNADKLELCEANRLQTQLLYGTEVLVQEERDGWAHILIPTQSTRKNADGYPGWVPLAQLAEPLPQPEDSVWAVVTSDRAEPVWPEGTDGARPERLSFLTRLPVLGEPEGGQVRVATPHGSALLRLADVRLEREDSRTAGEGSAAADAGAPAARSAGRVTAGQAAVPAEDASVPHAGARIVENGKRFLGLPYLWGGMSSYGYDCSGFAHNMHLALGIRIPRDASDQATAGRAVQKEELEPGDLLFFAYEEGKGPVHHVGIYAGENRMLHSPDSNSAIELVDLDGYKLLPEHCASRRYWG
ncbi:gamma-D-glutamyl-L-lysine endopeptidase [Paenibacillus sp. J31TS4]|uniref:C40 family peptidase n=1 Tax=Paenibacillus sp. J31TS4 TaxID=2807195 RepID=UPI001B2EDF2A|nr:NlpC/P60 family protein [Paenibacillus sp. J31TS4]GIP37738.1 gamma-D-glutamyl-L-lysine endopeptidase [Paenibacillus sp. J31TS4]